MENEMNVSKEKCPKCNGNGGFIYGVPMNDQGMDDPRWVRCPKCKGFKYLDWIEMVMGKGQ